MLDIIGLLDVFNDIFSLRQFIDLTSKFPTRLYNKQIFMEKVNNHFVYFSFADNAFQKVMLIILEHRDQIHNHPNLQILIPRI